MTELFYLLAICTIMKETISLKKELTEKNYQASIDEQASALIQYYKNKNLTILGLNSKTYLKEARKILLDLKDTLSDEDFSPLVIDVFNDLFNKTEHINYLFESNLTKEEIIALNKFSSIAKINEFLKKYDCPSDLTKPLEYLEKKEDANESYTISSALYHAEEPLILYTSGIDNLLREIGIQPSDLFSKEKKLARNYDLNRITPQIDKIIQKVTDGIQKNWENLYTLNPSSGIYVIDTIPIQKIKEDTLKYFLLRYQEAFLKIAQNYQVSVISSNKTMTLYDIEKELIHAIYENKIQEKVQPISTFRKKQPTMNAPKKMAESLYWDYHHTLAEMEYLSGTERDQKETIAREQLLVRDVYEKVLQLKKK